MSGVPKSCMDCGVPTKGRRCRQHQREWENNRSGREKYRDPVYQSYVKDAVCANCGSTEDLTKDHVIPNGNNSASNLQTLCRRCNSSKGNRLEVAINEDYLIR